MLLVQHIIYNWQWYICSHDMLRPVGACLLFMTAPWFTKSVLSKIGWYFSTRKLIASICYLCQTFRNYCFVSTALNFIYFVTVYSYRSRMKVLNKIHKQKFILLNTCTAYKMIHLRSSCNDRTYRIYLFYLNFLVFLINERGGHDFIQSVHFRLIGKAISI